MRVLIGLLKPYDIVQTAPGTLVAEFFFTSTPFFIIIIFALCQAKRPVSRPPPRRSSSLVPQPRLVLCVSLHPHIPLLFPKSSKFCNTPLNSVIHSDKVSSSKSLQDEELKDLIAQPLRAPKKKKKAAAQEETQA